MSNLINKLPNEMNKYPFLWVWKIVTFLKFFDLSIKSGNWKRNFSMWYEVYFLGR